MCPGFLLKADHFFDVIFIFFRGCSFWPSRSWSPVHTSLVFVQQSPDWGYNPPFTSMLLSNTIRCLAFFFEVIADESFIFGRKLRHSRNQSEQDYAWMIVTIRKENYSTFFFWMQCIVIACHYSTMEKFDVTEDCSTQDEEIMALLFKYAMTTWRLKAEMRILQIYRNNA